MSSPDWLNLILCSNQKVAKNMISIVRNSVILVSASLLLFVSCVPIPDAVQSAAMETAAPQTYEPHTLTQPSVNVAMQGRGRGSTKEKNGHWRIDIETAHRAIDGDTDSVWSSEQHPTQWFAVDLEDRYLVDRVEMVVAQFPSGPTTHEVWIGNGSGVRTLSQQLVDVHTEDGQLLRIEIEPPQVAEEVLFLTLDGPSWVAWRELRVFGSPAPNTGDEKEPQLKLTRTASGLELPVQVTHAGDGSGRIFVVEQKGRIRIIDNGLVKDEPFLDISNRVSCCTEQGLLNIAFPPSYSTDQQFFVSYTDEIGTTVISRFATSEDSNRAKHDSEEVVLTIDQPVEIHNGGHLAFGPLDGFLYIGSGDGGLWYQEGSQDPTSLQGKILRIDVNGPDRPYSVPDSNPLVHNEDYRGEIWAFGIRNPWGFAFDMHTGDLFLPDVGLSTREEVNFQSASSPGGENYGWPIMEGSVCFEFWPCTEQVDGLTPPVAEYDRSQGCAVVGGVVYRGGKIPGLQGLFLFADFCTGRIWALKSPESDSHGLWHARLLANAAVPVSSVGQDEEGNVYVTGYQDGVIYALEEN